ncbi:MAG: arylamine N-acetyltransferase [Micrococcales bacterium]|nr:arylamine N-acetyltransferase [Micrococcales bacterium]
MGGDAWALWRKRSTGWEHMHTTDELPVRPVDVAMGHHWTSTSPSSHFLQSLTVARHSRDDDGAATHTTVTVDGVTHRRAGEPTRQRPLDVDELPELLANLTDDEIGRLMEAVDGMRRDRAS